MIKTSFYPQLTGNLRREFLIWKSYRFNAISSLIMWAVIFPFLMAIIQSVAVRNGLSFGRSEQAASLVGFLAWRLCVVTLTGIPRTIEQEARTGTLENVVVSSSVSMREQIIIRAATRSLFAIFETMVLAISMMGLFGLSLSFSLPVLFITLLMLSGIWGLGFAIAGIALIYKSILTLVSIFTNLVLIFSIIPIHRLGIVFITLKIAFPLTWGIELLRDAILFDASLNKLAGSGELVGLLLQTLILLVSGLFIFDLCFRRAKKLGVLGAY